MDEAVLPSPTTAAAMDDSAPTMDRDAAPAGQRRRRFSLGSLGDSLPNIPDAATSPGRRFSWSTLATRYVIGGSSADQEHWDLGSVPDNFYDLTAKDAAEQIYPLAPLFGSVCLVVNVASY